MRKIGEELRECVLCGETHKIEICEDIAETEIKGKTIEYPEIFYYCAKTKDSFYSKKNLNANLLSSINSYRKNHKLLTSQEIESIRKEYLLSQEEFSKILGFGDITINRYETKQIQDETYDEKMREFFENPLYAFEELQKHATAFIPERYAEIEKLILQKNLNKSSYFFRQQTFKSLYAPFREINILNGFTELNLNKVENLIRYFSGEIDNLYKVKLMKLLWYVDFALFKRLNQSMTGLVYQHYPYGAVPVGYEELISSFPSISITPTCIDGEKIAYKITSLEKADLSMFKADELMVIGEIIKKLGSYGSREISKYMHLEKAYQETNANDIISYDFAKDLREF